MDALLEDGLSDIKCCYHSKIYYMYIYCSYLWVTRLKLACTISQLQSIVVQHIGINKFDNVCVNPLCWFLFHICIYIYQLLIEFLVL